MKTIRSMLKHLFLAVPLMLIMSCNSQPPSTLIPHRCENGKFGYVDEKGKEWIEGKYDYAERFNQRFNQRKIIPSVFVTFLFVLSLFLSWLYLFLYSGCGISEMYLARC